MLFETKRERLACDLELQTAQEQDRRFCTSHPTEKAGPCEPVRNVRCAHTAREFYRNQFTAER